VTNATTTATKKNRTRRGKRGNNSSQGDIANAAHSRFASTSATVGQSSSSGSGGVNETRLKSMLGDPSKNAVQVGGLSRSAKSLNGSYKGIIEYFSSMLTYDHLIYPVLENPLAFMEEPSAMQLDFAQKAVFLDRMNIRFHLPIFTTKILTDGILFLYKTEDSKGVAFMEMPTSFCRIGYIEDGVYRFQIDVTKLTDETVLNYPKEIQSAYTGYQSGNVDKLIEGKFYEVSDKGVAFTIDGDTLTQGGVGMPPLASALLDVLKVDSAKNAMEETSKLDNTKIVHSKIETDEKGRPLMELPVVHQYHGALKRSLPEGSVAITNPFETNVMSLNGTGRDGKFSLLERTVDNLFESAGVSKLLFAGDGASSQALERSIQVDAQWLYATVLPIYSNYFNYELKKASKKGSSWKIKFLQTSHFDRETAIKTSKDQLSNGGSRQEYLAHTGMTPLEVANMLVFEQRIMNIDDIMIAKQTSFTMSSSDTDGKTQDNEAGAPKSSDPTDTTTRIKDSE
jgi:hypothetical protein